MSPARAVLCVSVDCECDKGPRWRLARPLAFAGIRAGIGERLHPLFRRFGAKPTYLLSPEVLRDGASVELLGGLAGCELGTHLHGELAEPGAFEPEVTAVLQRDYPPAIERAKLASLTAAFGAAFGRRPRSFRAGRFGVGAHTVGFLEDLGYLIESSVTPHVDWSALSAGCSFVGAPTQPYRPDPGDAARPGESALLEVPVTVHPGILSRVPWLGRRTEARWLRPTRASGRALVALARAEIGRARRARPERTVVLHAMLHNVEVVAGASPYAATEHDADRILGRLAALLDFASREGISGVGLADVPEVLGE